MTSRGLDFEIEVFDLVKRTVREGGLGLLPDCARVFHHRPYFSPARNKNIFFDVTIEVTLPGAPAPSFIWIWECKDYKKLVPVDDIEEFNSKLEQVGAANTKGLVITRAGFQEAAFNFAKDKKIALARLMPESQVDWILHRARSTERRSTGLNEIKRALTQLDHIASNQAFFGVSTGFRTMRDLTVGNFLRLQFEEWGVSLGK